MDRAEVSHRGASAVSEFVQIQLAEQDGARVFQTARDFGVCPGNAIFKELARAGGADAGGIDVVFQGDGNAVKRPAPFAAPLLVLHLARLRERLISRNSDVGINGRIQLLGSLEAGLGELDGRHGFGAELLRGFLDGPSSKTGIFHGRGARRQ